MSGWTQGLASIDRRLGMAVLIAVAGWISSCGEGQDPLQPIDLAFLQARNGQVQGGGTAGTTGTFLEFDVVRRRDQVSITAPINVSVDPSGRSENQAVLRDEFNNLIFTERAVAVLGNGPDLDGDGVPEPIPDTIPQTLDPLAPFSTPEGWNNEATLAYVPGQTSVPLRAISDRFGVYLSSIVPFESRFIFRIRDQAGFVFGSELNINFPAGSLQSVTVNVGNATASEAERMVIAVCNQLSATLYIGLSSGATAQVAVPTVEAIPDTPLNESTQYVAEAYQFTPEGSVIRVSSDPANSGQLSVPLLGSNGGTGTATLTLTDSVEPTGFVTCAGDPVDDLDEILSDFFG